MQPHRSGIELGVDTELSHSIYEGSLAFSDRALRRLPATWDVHKYKKRVHIDVIL